jgi:HD-GYP domain-containing protein (c-di-GMP phosphodiesterase class II)
MQLEEAHLDAIYMLAAASEAKDDGTGDHVRRLQSLTAGLARAMGLGERAAAQIGRAAILHDVGKLHVPDHILKKPGALTAEERSLMQRHTLIGEQIIPDRPFFAQARRVARSHHENWDGTGYPDALRATAIPLEARLVHVADVFDALTHARPYKIAWAADQAADYIREQTGKMFDPDAVEAFGELFRQRPADAIAS